MTIACAFGIGESQDTVKMLFIVGLGILPPIPLVLHVSVMITRCRGKRDCCDTCVGMDRSQLVAIFSITFLTASLLLVLQPNDCSGPGGCKSLFDFYIEYCDVHVWEHVNSTLHGVNTSIACGFSACACQNFHEPVFSCDLANLSSIVTHEEDTVKHYCMTPHSQCCGWTTSNGAVLCTEYNKTVCTVSCEHTTVGEVFWKSAESNGTQLASCNGYRCATNLTDKWTFTDGTVYQDPKDKVSLHRQTWAGDSLTPVIIFGVCFVGCLVFQFIALGCVWNDMDCKPRKRPEGTFVDHSDSEDP